MADGERGVDFIAIDGGEGGTGAAPLVFSDAVALPFRLAFARVYGVFAEAGLTDRVVWVGSGKLGLRENALVGFSLGGDKVHVAGVGLRALGWSKAQRVNNYLRTLRRDLLKVSEACGVWHPGLLTVNDVELLLGNRKATPLSEVYGYEPGWGTLSDEDAAAIIEIMSQTAPSGDEEEIPTT